jgi:hypothetical protein
MNTYKGNKTVSSNFKKTQSYYHKYITMGNKEILSKTGKSTNPEINV